MDVQNATAAANLLVNNAQSATARNDRPAEKPQEKQPDSTVVKLSEQAQQLQRAENQQRANTENQNRVNAENQQRANAEQQRANAEAQRNNQRNEAARQNTQPPGINFLSGENKGGRIKTSA